MDFLSSFLFVFSWLWVGVFLVLDPPMKMVMVWKKLLRRIQPRMAPPLSLTMLEEWAQVIKSMAESSFSGVNSIGFCFFSLLLELWLPWTLAIFWWFIQFLLLIGFLEKFFVVLIWRIEWRLVVVGAFLFELGLCSWDPSCLCAVLLTSSLCLCGNFCFVLGWGWFWDVCSTQLV